MYIDRIGDYRLLELPFIDALDYKKSKIDYFEDSPKQLKRIRKYVFLEEKLKDIFSHCRLKENLLL